MTTKQKIMLLRRINHKPMSRKQIERYCSGSTLFERESEIDSLCGVSLIQMISDPRLEAGVFIAEETDLFGISDGGKDYLADVSKDRLRTYLPISISIFSLLVSAASLVVSIIAISK